METHRKRTWPVKLVAPKQGTIRSIHGPTSVCTHGAVVELLKLWRTWHGIGLAVTRTTHRCMAGKGMLAG